MPKGRRSPIAAEQSPQFLHRPGRVKSSSPRIEWRSKQSSPREKPGHLGRPGESSRRRERSRRARHVRAGEEPAERKGKRPHTKIRSSPSRGTDAAQRQTSSTDKGKETRARRAWFPDRVLPPARRPGEQGLPGRQGKETRANIPGDSWESTREARRQISPRSRNRRLLHSWREALGLKKADEARRNRVCQRRGSREPGGSGEGATSMTVRCQCRIFAMTEKLFADHLESSVTFFAETLIASF